MTVCSLCELILLRQPLLGGGCCYPPGLPLRGGKCRGASVPKVKASDRTGLGPGQRLGAQEPAVSLLSTRRVCSADWASFTTSRPTCNVSQTPS